jgi:WD40 repeat protein
MDKIQIGLMDGTVWSWSPLSSQLEPFPYSLHGAVTCLVWCHGTDPKFLAASDSNGTLHIFERNDKNENPKEKWKRVLSFGAHKQQVTTPHVHQKVR